MKSLLFSADGAWAGAVKADELPVQKIIDGVRVYQDNDIAQSK